MNYDNNKRTSPEELSDELLEGATGGKGEANGIKQRLTESEVASLRDQGSKIRGPGANPGSKIRGPAGDPG